MASGQKLLADLLGITSSATDSIWSSRLLKSPEEDEDGVAFEKSQNGSNFPLQLSEIKVMDSVETHPGTSITERKKDKNVKTDNISIGDMTCKDKDSVTSGDAYDISRCIEAGVPMKILKGKENSLDSSERSQVDISSTGSSERLPTPDPSDFIKPGVFVSSAQKSLGSVLSYPKDVKSVEKQRQFGGKQQEEITPYKDQQNLEEHFPSKQEMMQSKQQPQQHQNLVFSQAQIGNSMGTVGLQQGTENMNMTNFDAAERESEDVVVSRYPEGQKKTIIQEKFKERMQNSLPVKKIAIPKIVKQHQADSGSGKVEVDLTKPDTKAVSSSVHADEAVSFAAVATSAAIAPFLQIQSALENQISSLVTTMNRAHSAEQEYNTNSQKQGFKELESKVLQLLDQRLRPSETQDQHRKVNEATTAEGKVASGRHGKEDMHQQSHFGVSYTGAELQHVPTRQYGDFKTSLSPLNKKIPPSTHAPLLSQPQLWSSGYIRPQTESIAPPRSHPVPVEYFDKLSSRGSAFKRHQANAETQTSSSESSLVSERSILETPLPRSKIPVPFTPYTPKNRHNKRIAGQHTGNGKSLLGKTVKERKQREFSEKENMPPRRQEAKQFPKESRSDDKVKSYDSEELNRVVDDEFKKRKAKDEYNPLNGTHIIAPIDRYLIYPLRGQGTSLQNDPTRTRHMPGLHENAVMATMPHEKHDKAPEEESNRGHYLAANRILSEIQQRRERLESNLGAILRQKDEQRLYAYLDQHDSLQFDEINRIRRDVDAKIEEISSQLKKEFQATPKDLELNKLSVEAKKKDVRKQGAKDFPKGRKEKVNENAQAKTGRSKAVTEKKERNKRKGITGVEPSSATQRQDIQKPPQYNPAVLASIFGEQFHKPRRSTVRPPYIQFHSPPKTLPKNERGTKQQAQQEEDPRLSRSKKKESKPPKYYFQPVEPQFPEPSDDFHYPARGELVPVAKSLGKPRQDDRFRLPIPSEDLASAPSNARGDIDKLIRSEATKSNVAFVEIISDPPDNENKEKIKALGIQILPSVDIQGELELSKLEKDEQKTPVQHITVSPPKPEDYQDFQNYIACLDVEESDNDDEESSDDHALEFQGVEEGKPREYTEPRFPPQRPHCEVEPKEARIKYRTSLEQRTQEWLEQELLARIVAQMNIPQDPTIVSQQHLVDDYNDSSGSDAEDEEGAADWIHEILGAAGVQLCIDAGIPLDKGLIGELVENVVAEKVKSLLGHPKRPQPQQPKKDILDSHRESFDGLQNVLTPLQTPDYTPLQSEASAIHTPLSASTTTEESISEEASLQLEDKNVTFVNEEDSKTADRIGNSIKLATPPRTPDASNTPMLADGNVDTPVSSIREEERPVKDAPLVPTPDISGTAPSVLTLDDFMSSQPEVSESLPEKPSESPENVPLTLPRVQAARKTPSTQVHSFSISSSTTVGTSMFEGISEGERLCPDNVIPGLYSEGEVPLSEGQAVQSIREDNEEDEMLYQKKLLQNMIDADSQLEDATDNPSATLKDTEDLNEDTLEEVSISEGELLIQDSPIAKLLIQMRSPGDDNANFSVAAGAEKDRSEGEISKGEDVINNGRPDMIMREQRSKNHPSLGYPKRLLSVGEIAEGGSSNSNNNNGSHAASLSVGEVKAMPDERKDLRKYEGDLATSPAFTAADPSRGLKPEEFPSHTMQSSVEDESLTEQVVSHYNAFADGSTIQGLNTILVQSGNFGTTSTFNFTDSLNDPRGDVANEQKINDVMDVSEERSEISDDVAKDVVQRQPSGDKQPTKIMLMIPSVADEDSCDDITLERDDASDDDVSNISL